MSSEVLKRRRYPRRRFQKAIGMLYDGKYQICTGEEIGEGGVSFHASTPVPADARIIITFAISGADFCSVRAQVRHCGKSPKGNPVLGVMFTNINFRNKTKIRKYIGEKTEAEARSDLIELQKAKQKV